MHKPTPPPRPPRPQRPQPPLPSVDNQAPYVQLPPHSQAEPLQNHLITKIATFETEEQRVICIKLLIILLHRKVYTHQPLSENINQLKSFFSDLFDYHHTANDTILLSLIDKQEYHAIISQNLNERQLVSLLQIIFNNYLAGINAQQDPLTFLNTIPASLATIAIALLFLNLDELNYFIECYKNSLGNEFDTNLFSLSMQLLKNDRHANNPFYYAIYNPDIRVFEQLLAQSSPHYLLTRNKMNETIMERAAFGLFTGNLSIVNFPLIPVENDHKIEDVLNYYGAIPVNPHIFEYLAQEFLDKNNPAIKHYTLPSPLVDYIDSGDDRYTKTYIPQYIAYKNEIRGFIQLPGVHGFSLLAIAYIGLWLNWEKDNNVSDVQCISFRRLLQNLRQTIIPDRNDKTPILVPSLLQYSQTLPNGMIDLKGMDLLTHSIEYNPQNQKKGAINDYIHTQLASFYLTQSLSTPQLYMYQQRKETNHLKPLKYPFLGLLHPRYNYPNLQHKPQS